MNEDIKLILGKSEEVIPTLDDNSIDLVVTSPPYNVDLGNNKFNKSPYDLYNDNKDHSEYIAWLKDIFQKIYKKLVSGGRVAINIGDGKNGCYDDQTEVLTKEGWKLFENLEITDEVLTLNRDTKKIIYERPSEIQKYDYNGKMYNFHSSSLNLSVTPNHRMMVERHHTKGWMITEAEKLAQRQYKLPRALGIWEKNNDITEFILPPIYIDNYKRFSDPIKIKIEDWLEFIGWYVTEGCCDRNKFSVILSQSSTVNKQKFTQIVNLVKRMNFNFCITHKNNIKISSKQLYSYVYPLGKTLFKYLPIDLSEMSPKHLQILFDTMIKGDGCIHSNKQIRFFTISKKLAEQMQIIALKLGYSTRVSKRIRKPFYNKKMNRMIKPKYTSFELTFTRKKHYNIDTKKNVSLIDYKGKVYCCTTKNGIIYVRRNGTSVWCGNSIPTHSDIIHFMTHELNYIPMANIIWEKSQIGNRFSWGSYASPSCPSFPKPFEYIMIFAKDSNKLQTQGETDLHPEEFKKWAFSIWHMTPETKMKKIGHPACFPVDLPYRLIKMLSWKKSTILDPFSGSGTTGIACNMLGRKYIGIEVSQTYYDLSLKRINDTKSLPELDMFSMTK